MDSASSDIHSQPSAEKRLVEDYPLCEVPEQDRKSALSLSWVLFGFTFFTATMMAGGQVGLAFGWGPKLLGVIVLGNALLAMYASLLAVVAFRSGLSTVLMCRFAFGDKGSRLADLLLGLTQIGWYAWGTDTAVRVLLEMSGWNPDLKWVLMPLAGAVFCSSAYLGYRGLELLSIVIVPMMAVMAFWSGWLAWQQAPSQAVAQGGMGLAQALTVIVGTFVSGATQSTNWSRYARTQATAVWVTAAAFFFGNGLMVLFGALGAAVYHQADITKILLQQGFFASALFMMLANIWSTQDNTIYNVSVAGCHFFRSERRRVMTLAGGALGTGLAMLGFADHLVPFLVLLGTGIPPLGGVILAEFFWVRQGRFPPLAQFAEPDYRLGGLLAYALGAIAATVLPGIPPITGIVGAFLAHGLLARGRGSKAVKPGC
jgi:cytosine permease